MESKSLAVLMIAVIGGLVSGIVCTGILLFTAYSFMQSTVNSVFELSQHLTFDCQEDYAPLATILKFGKKTYYCKLRVEEKGQENEIQVSPVPGVT